MANISQEKLKTHAVKSILFSFDEPFKLYSNVGALSVSALDWYLCEQDGGEMTVREHRETSLTINCYCVKNLLKLGFKMPEKPFHPVIHNIHCPLEAWFCKLDPSSK